MGQMEYILIMVKLTCVEAFTGRLRYILIHRAAYPWYNFLDFQVESHIGTYNLGFKNSSEQLSVVICGDDKTVEVNIES